jgi:TonB-dependent starch-binding outer membrane protein SusC
MRSITRVGVPTVIRAVLMSCLTTSSLLAQVGTIRGRVTEVGSNRPIAEAQVTVTGTAFGAVTNASGDYTIANVPAGAREVAARRLGFQRRAQTVTVTASSEVRADFSLTQAASQLDALVVTGTAGAAEKRTIGNAITQLDVSDITSKTTLMTVSDVLQGRTPGVAVMSSSGTPGTSSEITIRGYGSFTNNRPVVLIDGVRMDTDDIGSFNPSGAGTSGFSGQRTSALDMINPNDIESVEVIKGPAASTLYGADAAGGVIQIITKKGRRGQQPLRWSTRWETGTNQWGARTLTNYSTCTQARIDQRDGAGNATWPGCFNRDASGLPDLASPLPVGTLLTDDPLARDQSALRDGDVNNLSMSLRGGGDRYSFYVSADGIHEQGVFHNSNDDRRSLRTNFTFNPNTLLDFNVNVGYIRSRLRLPLGDEAFNGLLLSASRGIPGLLKTSPKLNGWGSVAPIDANAYDNQTVTDRFLISTTVNYLPFRWFRNRLTAGMDKRLSTAQILSLPGDIDTPSGLNALRSPKTTNLTLDYSGSADFNLMSDLLSTTSIGGQLQSTRTETISATGSQLPTREITTIGAALSVSGSNAFSEFNQVGGFIQEQFGWKNRLFATGAVRMDDASSFGSNFDALVYPKASLSYVLTEEPVLAPWFSRAYINSFRFRGAWGMAGRAPQPYDATQRYGSTRVAIGPTGVGGALTAAAYGNPDLKPEKGTEVELGFDSEMLSGRAGLEFTYYRKEMRDLLVPIALPPSLGFSGSQIQNLGHTRNSGIEMSLSGTAVSLRNFVWEPRLNYTRNSNVLLALDTIRSCKTWLLQAGESCPAGRSAAEELPGGTSYSPGMQRNRVGYPLGSYFLRFPARDAQGNYIFNRNATTGALTSAVYDTTFRFVGQATPTRLISLSNTFTLFKNFRIYALLDYQGGHHLFNYKEFNRCATVASGPNCERLNQPGISDTIRVLYGTNGDATTLSSPSTQTLYVEKADFTKLRDVSLTVLVPNRLVNRLRMESMSLVFSGRNLALWTDYSGLDPEVNGYSNNQLRGSGNAAQFARVDAFAMPMTKRYTFQVNLTY